MFTGDSHGDSGVSVTAWPHKDIMALPGFCYSVIAWAQIALFQQSQSHYQPFVLATISSSDSWQLVKRLLFPLSIDIHAYLNTTSGDFTGIFLVRLPPFCLPAFRLPLFRLYSIVQIKIYFLEYDRQTIAAWIATVVSFSLQTWLPWSQHHSVGDSVRC